MVLYPNELGGRFKKYMDLKIKRTVYKFICTYVQRIKLDVKCKKLLTKNPGALFFCKIHQATFPMCWQLSRMGRICGSRQRRDKWVIPEQVLR